MTNSPTQFRNRNTKSPVASARYDNRTQGLRIAMRRPGKPVAVYTYAGVGQGTFNAFAAAKSKGKFYNAEIKDKFPCALVSRRDV